MELQQKVKALLDSIDKTHRYSMSEIYAIYNEVFGVDEKPQSCASCLIRKVNCLRKWLNNIPATARQYGSKYREKNRT